MPTLQTNLNVAPYYDDFDENKQYYRILFRPSTAVQARELTQLQTILQNQVTKIGDSLFKDGSIVEGCGFTQYRNIDQVKFKDSNTSTLDFGILTVNHTDLANAHILVSNTTGLRAVVFRAFSGAESAVDAGSADTNRAYVIYVNSGNNAGVQVSTFNYSSEQIDVYAPAQDPTGPLNTANRLGSIYTLSSNSTVNALGVGYGLHVSQGTIYQKGFFLKVLPDNIIIKEHTANAVGIKVGFDTREYVITAATDNTLYDNSIGSPNYAAPGAHRLKLVPTLVSYDSSNTQVTIPTNFMPIIDFSGGTGVPVTQQQDPNLAAIGDLMAKRTFEESGNYVVKPFQIDVTAHESNNQLFYYGASPGIAYVDGYRVEYLSPRKTAVNRAITTDWLANQKVTTNFGSYVRLRDVAGTFDIGRNQEVTFYSANQAVLSLNQSLNAPLGVATGKANIRAISYNTNAKGYPSGEYLAYLFNIRMNSGSSFAANARSIVVTNGTYGNAYADIVLDSIQGFTTLYETDKSVLLYNTGLPGVRRLTSNTGVSATSYIYRSTLTSAITRTNTGPGSGNNITSVFTAPSPDAFNYGIGTLTDAGEPAINITFNTDFVSNPILGNWTTGLMNPSIGGVSNSTCSNIVTGDWTANFNGTTPGASLLAYVQAGQGLMVTSSVGTTYHTIVSVNSANSITLTPNVSATTIPTPGSITLFRFFKKGTPIDFSGSGNTINFTSPTSMTVTVALDANTTAASNYTLNAQVPTLKSPGVPIQKVVNQGVFVAINCASHWTGSAGPWNLGIPDIYSVSNVYVGSTFSTTNPDRSGWFTFDSGQQDSYYGHGRLIINPRYASNITSASRILVKLNSFSANITTTKAGFFSVDSYPVDDIFTSNTQAIQTAQIPVYSSVSGINYDLRNHIDFRPVFANTAVYSTTAASATINPANNNTILVIGTGNPIAIEPNANFNYNVEYYLPRVDNLILNKDGALDVKQGVPSVNPVAPAINTSGLKLADVYVPPYPSLTFIEAE